MDVLAVVVAACALGFTVGTFWWQNVRQGKLVSFEPHSFVAAVDGSAVLLLRFPLVFFNSGAKPIVVQDLRLVFPDVAASVLPLPWRLSRSQLKPAPDDGHQFPAAFAIPGRSAHQHFIEFGGPFPGFVLEAIDYKVRVEAELGYKKGWQGVVDFTLRAGEIAFPERFIAYSNSPGNRTSEDVEKARAAIAALIERLGRAQRP